MAELTREAARRRGSAAIWLLTGVGSLVLAAAAWAAVEVAGLDGAAARATAGVEVVEVRDLPPPVIDGSLPLEQAIELRRSVRVFEDRPLSSATLGQLLWAAQGRREAGGRTAPSAGGLYPLEVYVASADGLVRYRPAEHAVETVVDRDLRSDIHDLALQQRAFRTAPAVVVMVGVEERMARKYGARAERYVLIEVGHAAQNLLLEATALGLGAVPTGAFRDAALTDLLELPAGWAPLYLIPVGPPAASGS